MHSQSWLKVEINHMDRVILKSLKWNAKRNERHERNASWAVSLAALGWTLVVKSSDKNSQNGHLQQHSALWLCCGYLLYVFTLGKHIIYYSHNIIYICIYIFLPPLTKKKCPGTSFSNLLPDHWLQCSYLILPPHHKRAALFENLWESGDVCILLDCSHILVIPPEPECELQTSSRVAFLSFCRLQAVSPCSLG